MKTPIPSLLRRTLAVLGAFAALAVGGPVAAQTITLSGTTGNSCSFSTMTVSSTGNVTVNCGGGTTNPPPQGVAIFAVSGPTTIAPSTTDSTNYKVTRTDTSGPAESVAFGYTIDGTGCVFASWGPYWLTAGQSYVFPVTSNASGNCTVSLTIQEGHQGNPKTMSINVAGSPPVDPPPVGNCPAAETGSFAGTMPTFGYVDQLRMASGQIAYYPVAAAPNPARSVVVEVTQGQQPNQPSNYSATEFSVSKCPGRMDQQESTQCYYKSGQINNNKIVIYTEALPQYGWIDQTTIGDRGCFAPAANGQYYVNVRWTYGSCPWTTGCGFSMQWAEGSNF